MAVIELTIDVPDVDLILPQYSHIKIYRADIGPYGELIYEPISDSQPVAAIIEAPSDEPWDLSGGGNLQLKIDRDPMQDISFDYSQPMTVIQAIQTINAQFYQELRYSPATLLLSNPHRYIIQSPVQGRESTIEVLGGTAVSALGLTIGTVIGFGQHIKLFENILQYHFIDFSGEETAWYRCTYINLDTGLESDLSDPFQGVSGTIAPPEDLSSAEVKLVDGSGVPVSDVEVRFYLLPPFPQKDYGVLFGKEYLSIVTDGKGEASIDLIRGASVKVVLVGQSFIREFIVPDEDSFNVMTVEASQPDAFEVVRTGKTYAVRRSP